MKKPSPLQHCMVSLLVSQVSLSTGLCSFCHTGWQSSCSFADTQSHSWAIYRHQFWRMKSLGQGSAGFLVEAHPWTRVQDGVLHAASSEGEVLLWKRIEVFGGEERLTFSLKLS